MKLDKITCNDIELDLNSGLENIEEKWCDGTINVIDQEAPNISCKWENYEAGKKPSVIVEITSERGTKCEPPTVKETNWSGFWQDALPADGPSPYKIEGFSNLGDDDIDTGIDITVETVCTGIMAGTYSEVCVKEAGGGAIEICSTNWDPISAGTHTVTIDNSCNGGAGSFKCYGNDGVAKTVSYNDFAQSGAELAGGSTTWRALWSRVPSATITVSAGTIYCTIGY